MAELLEWKSEYDIGNEMIDTEHQTLFQLANAVFSAKMTQSRMDSLGPLVHQLYAYMKTHFDHEEAFMAEMGFKEIDGHKNKHADIIREMNSILKTSRDVTVLADNLARMMVKWILKHILEEDMKIRNVHG